MTNVAPRGLARKTFSVSRLAEFASVAELVKQTGHAVEEWPLAIVKELTDNALDEAEDAGTAPEIEIIVADNSIVVADLGRGIAPATVELLIDYLVRTSSRAAYVSPTRGAQIHGDHCALVNYANKGNKITNRTAWLLSNHGLAVLKPTRATIRSATGPRRWRHRGFFTYLDTERKR